VYPVWRKDLLRLILFLGTSYLQKVDTPGVIKELADTMKSRRREPRQKVDDIPGVKQWESGKKNEQK
jgi:hypothetical protein